MHGSSAGAGSGEFDVYRSMKRREQLRLEAIEKEAAEQSRKEELSTKVANNKRQAEV